VVHLDDLPLFASHDRFNAFQKDIGGNKSRYLHQGAHHDRVGRALVPERIGELRGRNLIHPHVMSRRLDGNNRRIQEDGPAGCRAVLEGHVLNLYDSFNRMGLKPKEIRLTGGLARSEAWQQVIADVFEAETVPVEGEGAALGAALHAAWVFSRESGINKPLKEIIHSFIKLRQEERKTPIPENVEAYRLLKQAYNGLSSRIRNFQNSKDPFDLRNQLIKLG